MDDSSTKILQMLFTISGGIGIFLLGMKNMSDGMQAIAGNKLRKLINAVTTNRVIACVVGLLVTATIQSSSVTTVMLVGMVNAGVMSLMQAIGVILGADIGTTITAWILLLKLTAYGLPMIGFSAFFVLFTKKDSIRFTASFIMGLGMIFFGFELMERGFEPLKHMPGFMEWFSRFRPENTWGVIKCVLTGATVTAMIHSSSATIGITISLASVGILDFQTAAALVLGENIGTTITAWLSSLGTNTNAKRTAYAHIVIKVVGVTCMIIVFSYFIKLVTWMANHMIAHPDGEFPVTKAIPLAHTTFNILLVIGMLPFAGILAKLLIRFVPEKARKEMPHLTSLDVRMFDAPAFAIEQSEKEILKMSSITENMMTLLQDYMINPEPEKKKEKIFDQENTLDIMQKEIVEFISNIMVGNIPHYVTESGRKQLRMADEYESIGDYITNLLKLNLKMKNIKEMLSEEGKKQITELHNTVNEFLLFINQAVKDENIEILNEAYTKGNSITHMMKEFRTSHLDRVARGDTSPLKSLIFTDILNGYRRIKDHGVNIAEALAGEK